MVDVSQLAIEREEATPARVGGRRHVLTRYVVPIALLLGFVALFASATWGFVVPAKEVKVVPVHVTRATHQSEGTPLFNAAGWVQARPTPVRVAALAPGVVEELLVVEDQAVKKGDPIARLVIDDARLKLRHAVAERQLRQAELEQARATLAAAKVRFEQPVHLQAPSDEAEAKLARVELELNDLPFEIRQAEARRKLAAFDLKIKIDAGTAVSELQVEAARSQLETGTARVEELRKRTDALTKERDAAAKRRDALRTQLELKTDETQAKDVAAAKVTAAEAHLEHARVSEAEAQLALDRMTIIAPITGRVLHLIADPGTRLMADMGVGMAKDGSTVVTMYRPESLQVRVDVRFEDMLQVQEGQPVLIESPAVEGPLEGEVLFVSSLADIQKNTLEVKVAIHEPPAVFKPEMLVDVTFLAPKETDGESTTTEQLRLFVPNNLIERGDGGAFVWVADQDAGVARKVPVETGRAGANGTVEIKSGLTAASRLISSGREDLEDGNRIRVTGEEE